jgi:hypothetical protein
LPSGKSKSPPVKVEVVIDGIESVIAAIDIVEDGIEFVTARFGFVIAGINFVAARLKLDFNRLVQ